MEVTTIPSRLMLQTRMLAAPTNSVRTVNPKLNSSPYSYGAYSLRASLPTNFVAPFVGGSVSGELSGQKIRPESLNPVYFSYSHGKRGVVTMVICRFHVNFS